MWCDGVGFLLLEIEESGGFGGKSSVWEIGLIYSIVEKMKSVLERESEKVQIDNILMSILSNYIVRVEFPNLSCSVVMGFYPSKVRFRVLII